MSTPVLSARRGHTLLEVTTLLVLLALLGSSVVGGLRRALDRMAVHGAREEVAAMIARARAEGVLRGEARVVVTEDPARATLVVRRPQGEESPGEPAETVMTATVDLGLEYGVGLDVGGVRDRARLLFDDLGLGRMTSRSFRFRRGGATARLVVSSYGRVGRR